MNTNVRFRTVGLQTPKAVGRVESIRIIGDKTSTEYRYYLTSLIDLQHFGQSVRQHWAIESVPQAHKLVA